MAYLLLFVPAFAAAVVHWAFMPKFAALVLKEFGGLPLPPATNLVVQSAPIAYSIPAAMLCLACLARRFRIVNHPTVIGGIGAGLALWLYFYGVATTVPLITLFDTL